MSVRQLTARKGLAVALLMILAVGACSTSPPSPASSSATAVPKNIAADATTLAIARVEVARQCTIGSQSFPKESDLTADLDKRLAAAQLTHLAWKNWHDELATSPQLVKQFAELTTAGCPKS